MKRLTIHTSIALTLGLGLVLALLWLLSHPGTGLPVGRAASHTVCPAGPPDCDYSTIQDAVDAAGDGDVIMVATGTYTGVQRRPPPPGYLYPPPSGIITQVVHISKTVTIRGGYTTTFTHPPDPNANPTTLDAQDGGRVLFITGNISPTIEGLRITGGDATGLGGHPWRDAGGGVYVISATATISGCQVYGNTSSSLGGGLYLANSPATLNSNTITANTTRWYGGGLYLSDSPATLNNNTVTANTAHGGGGLYLLGSDATLSNNTVTTNTADFGGGLYLGYSGAMLSGNTVTANSGNGLFLEGSDATLSNNTVTANSGIGLFLDESDATLSNNTVTANSGIGLFLLGSNATLSNNTVSANGGEGLVLANSPATLSNNTVSANGSSGLYLYESDATLNSNTITSNTAQWGGGLHLQVSDAVLNNNLVTANTADYGGGLFLVLSSDVTLSGNTITSNTAQWGGGLYLEISSVATLTNTIVADNRANTAGSGLYIHGSFPRLLHTTIARNSGGDGSGIYVGTDDFGTHSSVALTNTILVSHTVGVYVENGNAAALEATLWGTATWANLADWGGAGAIFTGTINLWGDPDFVNPDGGDYHIGPGSAAIDAGVNTGVMSDIDGEPRPMGRGYDIGADELRIALAVSKQATPDPVQGGAQLTYTIQVANTGNMTLAATITDFLPAQVMPDGVLSWTPTITAPGGVWTKQFTVTVDPDYVGPLTNRVQVTTTEGATGTASVTVSVPPLAPLLISPANDTVISDTMPTLTWGTSLGAAGYLLDWNGTVTDVGDVTQYTVTVTADGTYTWTVAAYDALHNTSAYTDVWAFTVDTTWPDTTITDNPPDPDNDATPTFQFAGSDVGGSGVASFECQVDGDGWAACASPHTTVRLSDGSRTFEVRAIDNAGNTDPTPASYTWGLDTTPPTIMAKAPISGAVDVHVTTPVVITFSEEINTSIFSYTTSPDPGGWSASWSSAGAVVTLTHSPFACHATHTFTVITANDLAGNLLFGAPYAWHFTTLPYCVYLPLVMRD